MKEKLTKKIAGIPIWVILAIVFVGAYIVWRRRNAGRPKTNPAASANEDGTSPFPYSAPDMFPLQGPAGPAGPPGPAGPSVTAPAAGINAGSGQNWFTLPISPYVQRRIFRTSPTSPVGNTPWFGRYPQGGGNLNPSTNVNPYNVGR